MKPNKFKNYEKSQCIYKIPCNNCTDIYIGETIDFIRRRNQHKDDLVTNKQNSALTHHRRNQNHRINIDGMEPIIYASDNKKRKMTESFCIKNRNNFNKIQGEMYIDSLQNTIKKLSL